MGLFQHSKFDYSRLKDKKVLDIGCGRKKLPGSIGLDQLQLPGVDVVADLSQRLPFKDGEFDVVYSNQVFEHVPNLIGLIEEINRILVPGGILVAHVQYFRSSWAAIDPTHIRQFTISSLDYFVRGTLEHSGYRFSEVCFGKIEKYIDGNYESNPFRYFFSKLALRYPYRFENCLLSFIYPFEDLTFVLTK